MKAVRIPLQPLSRFHFGEFRFDVNLGLSSTSAFAHSDTLFSALVNSYAMIGDAKTIVDAFSEDRIAISSLFYYLRKGEKKIFFLPKPVFLEKDLKPDKNYKVRNKVKFVSTGVWEMGFNQENWTKENQFMILQNEFVLTQSEYNDFTSGLGEVKDLTLYKIVQSPKNPVRVRDYLSAEDTTEFSIYYQTDIEIADNKNPEIETGFYFLYSAEGDVERMLKDATNVLSKSGIGGERNNMGRIMGDPVCEDISMNFVSDKYTNLSVVSPKDIEDFRNVKLYKTFFRGGRRTFTGGYKTVRMIKEGALVTNKLKGNLVEIGRDDENNPALRNGKAFLIKVNANV